MPFVRSPRYDTRRKIKGIIMIWVICFSPNASIIMLYGVYGVFGGNFIRIEMKIP